MSERMVVSFCVDKPAYARAHEIDSPASGLHFRRPGNRTDRIAPDAATARSRTGSWPDLSR
jgi:hypothetical protein